jgi:hypothetical protein
MAIKRTSDGKYNYRCRNRKGRATTVRYCPGGDFAIRSHALNQPVYEAILKRIYDQSPIRGAPTPEDIRAFSLEERRLLLAASGLRAEVHPKNWTGEIQQGFHFGPTVQVTKGPNGERIEREVEPRAKQSKRVQVFFPR